MGGGGGITPSIQTMYFSLKVKITLDIDIILLLLMITHCLQKLEPNLIMSTCIRVAL